MIRNNSKKVPKQHKKQSKQTKICKKLNNLHPKRIINKIQQIKLQINQYFTPKECKIQDNIESFPKTSIMINPLIKNQLKLIKYAPTIWHINSYTSARYFWNCYQAKISQEITILLVTKNSFNFKKREYQMVRLAM